MAEEEEDEVDILHPLSTLHWEQGPSLSMDIVEARYVFVNNRLYVGSGMISHGTGLHDNEQLFIFSTNFDLLSKLTTPTTQFALTTYNSQPVLVGGVLSSTNKLSNQLWIRDEIKGIWDPSLLPPMPIARRDSSAINTGSTECIVVAGGCGETGLIDVVEILKQGQWLKLQHLPEPCWNMTSTLHNGKWYLNTMEGYMFCCKLESLLTDYEHSSDIWSKIDSNVNGYSIASFGQQLIIVGGSQLLLTRGIHALSPLTQSWVHIGDMHEELFYFTTIVLVLPTRELVVIGERVEGGGCSVLKASLTMSPYNSDNQFSMSALYRLEATGIYIVTSLYEVRTELEGILGVDKLWSVRKVISKWVSGRSRHPPTWRTILDILRKLDLVELSQQIEDYLSDNLSYIDAYRRILATQDSLEMLFVKIIFLGPPRLGKTTARRRLMGEIADISSAAEQEQPSTGAVESGGNVVMWTTSSTTALMTPSEWSVVKDLEEEACMLFQFFNMEQNHPSNKGSSEEKHTEVSSDKDKKFSSSVEEKKVHSDKVVEEKVHSDKIVEKVLAARIVSGEDSTSSFLKEQGSSNKPHGLTQIPKLFRKAVNRKYWKDIKRFFKDSALLKMEDTGGQPEFMDMLPALTIGPALYLLFCRLIDDLFSRYPVSYVSPLSGASTTPVESSYTVEEVLLTALASVSCFSSYSAISKSSVEEGQSSEVKEILESSFKSVAYIVGTHKDEVSEERIEEFDRQLQCSIRSTDFFRDLVKFYSEKRMILAIDNTNGGAKEIEKVRKFLERGIRRHFKKLRIPASWLVFSLFLRGRPEKIASLNDCHQLAWQLNMPSKETKIALWFLHHYAGVLMYFPDLPELEDTVICDTKIIYDSVTNLIINTFKFGSVSKWASETFRETGQFSMEDIKGATSEVSGDFIPPYKLVKLLEHLNIITPIVQDDSHSFQARPIQSSNVTYFMPCVLQNASCEALDIYSSRNPASLMIRYKCGFVPLGIFPAVIAHLVGHSPLKLIVEGIKKNCVQFQYGEDRDTVTLIYRTKYFEIHIKREHTTVTQIHDVCLDIRNIIESTLKTVSIPLHYVSLHYQLSFECPSHPGEDHLCVVDSKDSNPHKMDCLKNAKKPQPVNMQDQHLFWFGKALANNGGCTSGSNLQPEGDVREFNEELSSGDLYRYLLFEKVPKRDCDIIKEREISGVCFLDLSIQYLKSCELSEPGVIVITKLQNKIKATQTTITPNLSSPAPDYQAYMSSLSPCVHPLLEQLLDWDHGGVDVDLSEIANHMLDWEDRLSAPLGLTHIDTSDIKIIHLNQPPLQRREALRRWKNRCGFRATYGNLLKLCMEAGHTECAQVICDILKRKVEPHTSVSRVTVSSNVSTVSDSTDVREFSEELSCRDLYRYLLFKNVPKRDSGIIKEKEISGACFLDLSIQYLKSCGVSEPGVIVITKLQDKIKAAQTTITPILSPHVSDVKEFNEELSSGDLYRYLLFEKVPKRDCDVIKEKEISGACFLDLSIQYLKSCEISEPGVIVITKLQNKIKATQTTSPHVSGHDHVLKRRSESSHLEMEAHKWPRLSENAPNSPSLTSSSTSSSPHPNTPTPTVQHKPHGHQRSPVIKVIPYNPPGQLMLQTTLPSSLPQAIVLPASSINVSMSSINNQQQQQQQQQQQKKTTQQPHHHRQSSSLPVQCATASASEVQRLNCSPNGKIDSIQAMNYISSLPVNLSGNLKIVLLKCFGPVSESVISQNHLIVSNLLQDIYRQSYFTTSNCFDLPLSPESCSLLTICYLSSLQRGERISIENLRTMMHYAQMGELDWLHYYKKHKKMSESTFVQAQLIHLSRVAVYPVLGKVRIVISNQSLSEGIMMTLHKMVQLVGSSEQVLPEYWVILAVRPSSTIDFCVLVIDPLQVQLLCELKRFNSDIRLRKQQSKTQANLSQHGTKTSPVPHSEPTYPLHSGSKLFISKSLLLSVQGIQQKLKGGILIPFYQPGSVHDLNSDNILAGIGLLRMDRAMADTFSPKSSHLVEHKPKGPFQDQYNVAMHMLQKILSYWGNQTKIEEYKGVDFRVLCPHEASFVTQTVAEIAKSGLVGYLRLDGSKGKTKCTSGAAGDLASGEAFDKTGMNKEAEKRVICCGSRKDYVRFCALLTEIEHNQDTLYIIIAENSHMTNSVMTEQPPDTTPSRFYSDNIKLLCSLPNCIIIYVSSYPYSLQTNRSFISFANEIHWPISSDKSGHHFCSATDFKSNQFQNLESEFEYGVRFRDDQCFEEMLHEVITKNTRSTDHTSIATLRGQLLLNQYVSGLLGTIGKCLSACPTTPADVASPKTQIILNHLVQGPLKNPRGQGCMVIVRSHDRDIAKDFYHKLKAVRDSLGLSYRFEILYDDGTQFLTVSEHFHRRLSQWKGKPYMSGVELDGHDGDGGRRVVMSYSDLEDLPCLVVLAGEFRAGLSFPSSLQYVDLRLCYPIGSMTRLQYEYDTSFFNGYYKTLTKTSPTSGVSRTKEKDGAGVNVVESPVTEMVVSFNEDSDSEVFEGNSNTSEQIAFPRTNSSSSSRKSSYNEDGTNLEKPPPADVSQSISLGQQVDLGPSDDRLSSSPSHISVVEWKPGSQLEDNLSHHSSSPNGNKESISDIGTCSEGGDLKMMYGSTVTVTIDPPRDDGGEDVMSQYLGRSEMEEITEPCSTKVLGGLFEKPSIEEEECDLYESLNDMDMAEEEDHDLPPPTKIYLLSRLYYYIWLSRGLQQNLLLQPSPGVNWHGGHKRPPLFETDPRQQSAHYRKWTKPALREVRNQYDGVMKEANKCSKRRFLLTGPPQVGKTGAWILMIRLLYDHLRSSQGVTVEDFLIPLSIFLPITLHNSPDGCLKSLECSNGDRSVLHHVTAPPTLQQHSCIVPLEFLHSLLEDADSEESKNNIKVDPVINLRNTPTKSSAESSSSLAGAIGTTSRVRRVVSVPISQYMAYDFTHSCNECSKYVRGNPISSPEILTFSLPVKNGGGSLALKWFVPVAQQKHCVINSIHKTLERLKLTKMKLKGEKLPSHPMTPIFTPTLRRDSSGLFNLFHSQIYHLHVLVTSISEFVNYCKAWPNHIIMAMPDKESTGLGSMYHWIKEFAQYNLHLNNAELEYEGPSRIVWPLTAIISDNVVMMKKIESESGRSVDISLSSALQLYEQTTECLHYAAMSALPWNTKLEDGHSTVDKLTDYDLSHDFILLNLSKVSNIPYNQFSFNSAEVDFNLQLKACQSRTKLRKDLLFMKKYLPTGGNPYPLHSEVTGLCSEVDKLVISLHHDSSSHLPHPGPYLMEHYLLFKSQVLFPYAQNPQFPVLAVDHYISLGPHTYVSYIKSEMLTVEPSSSCNGGKVSAGDSTSLSRKKPTLPVEDLSKIRFGGLLLYLCEEKLASEHLKKLEFVVGASLCLVTQDCKTLVREVARLDLEEKWKFRLRDEYQTACADDMTPLFFLIGRFEG